MSRDKTNVELLQERMEMERRVNGLQYFHVTAVQGATEEQVAGHMLAILDAEARGECKLWSDY